MKKLAGRYFDRGRANWCAPNCPGQMTSPMNTSGCGGSAGNSGDEVGPVRVGVGGCSFQVYRDIGVGLFESAMSTLRRSGPLVGLMGLAHQVMVVCAWRNGKRVRPRRLAP